MQHVTGTLISYYFYCKRRLWLHANDIRYEDTSEDVAMGCLIEDFSYQQRSSQYEQIEMEGIKIDFYDYKNKIIHETKKSQKYEETHIWQLKYYIYVLQKNGISGVMGILEYPTERKRNEIQLTELEYNQIEAISKEIEGLIIGEACPPVTKNAKCRNCSYFEFCYTSEPVVE